jgi:DNA replication protein DnaC
MVLSAEDFGRTFTGSIATIDAFNLTPEQIDAADRYRARMMSDMLQEHKALKIKNILDKSGIPYRTFDIAWKPAAETAKARAMVDALIAADRHGKRGFLVWGPQTGTGKTRMMCEYLMHLVNDHQLRVRFFSELKLADRLSFGSFSREDEMADLVDLLCEMPVLAIDDLGYGDFKASGMQRFQEIIDTRSQNPKLITCFTSNKGYEQLIEHLGERAVSRIIGMAGERIVSIVGGVDMRAQR